MIRIVAPYVALVALVLSAGACGGDNRGKHDDVEAPSRASFVHDYQRFAFFAAFA